MNDNLKRWLPWIAVAAVAIIVVIIIAVNSGGDDEAAETTTTTAGETTTTVEDTTTTTTEETTTTTEARRSSIADSGEVRSVAPTDGWLASIIDALENPIRMGVDEINATYPTVWCRGRTPTRERIPRSRRPTWTVSSPASSSAILGPASTGVARSVFDKVQREPRLPMCSGSNTGASLSSAQYDPYYNRTAPSDEHPGAGAWRCDRGRRPERRDRVAQR